MVAPDGRMAAPGSLPKITIDLNNLDNGRSSRSNELLSEQSILHLIVHSNAEMESSMAKSEFDEWIAILHENNVPHRMMFVFLRVVAADKATTNVLIPSATGPAGWVDILFDFHKELTSKIMLRDVVKAADRQNDQWTVFAAVPSYNTDRSMPTQEQASVWITDIRACIKRGDYEGLPFFGRNGNRLVVQGTATVSRPPHGKTH